MRTDLHPFINGAVVVLYFIALVLGALPAFGALYFGGPLFLLVCVILPFIPPMEGFHLKCGAGLLGFIAGTAIAFPLAYAFWPPSMYAPTPLMLAGLLSPLGGIAGVLLARHGLNRRRKAQERNENSESSPEG